jgi:hypothetical protein
MRSALVVLSTAALFVTFFSTPPPAEAKGARSKDGAHRTYAGRERSGKAVVRTGNMPSPKRPGSCGTFMYWNDGKCNDARNKK